jgi:uroporphyrinogen-III synthase
MAHTVLVTRPIVQAREFAAEIEKKGFKPLIQPLLEIGSVPFSYQDIQKPDAILVTSIHGLGDIPVPRNFLDIPVFTVGIATADIVHQAGFKRIYSGHTDLNEIIPLIQQHVSKNSPILYLRGEVVKQNIQSILCDYHITEKITYTAKAIAKIETDIINSFPEINFLTLFSPRSGFILKELIQKQGLNPYLQSIKLLCLSRAVLESVKELNWQDCYVAENTTPQSMIETLERLKNE